MLGFWTQGVSCDGPSGYVLGKRYEFADGAFSIEFLRDCESCAWLRYRTNLAKPIPRHPDGPSPLLSNVNLVLRAASVPAAAALLDGGAFASDVGWGCMIRTGQSMLANALLELEDCRTADASPAALGILRLFSDTDTNGAPFSLYRFVEHGTQRCGKLPGQWFGPSAVAQCLQSFLGAQQQQAQQQQQQQVRLFSGLHCHVPRMGGDVYLADLTQFPVLVLCNLRLGLDAFNPVYTGGLRRILQCPQSVGIAGGRTSASLYFYGLHGDRLLYHDPHEPAQSLGLESSDGEVWQSTHSSTLRALPCSEMDPSMLAGFLIRSHTDLDRWRAFLMDCDERERAVHVHEGSAPGSSGDFGDADTDGTGDEAGGEVEAMDDMDEDDYVTVRSGDRAQQQRQQQQQ